MIRRVLLAIAFFAIALPIVFSQTIIPANAIQVTWDEVTLTEEGNPIPAGDSVSYEMVYAPVIDRSSVVIADEVIGPPYTFILPPENLYDVGVRTIRTTATGVRLSSATNWSDVDEPPGSTPIPFSVAVYAAPVPVTGLVPVSGD